MTHQSVLKLLKPLVASGLYKNETVALKDIMADFIESKIDVYAAIIKKMEGKYGKKIEVAAKGNRSKATMAYEDDWMEWKAAQVMKEAWQDALKKLLRNAA